MEDAITVARVAKMDRNQMKERLAYLNMYADENSIIVINEKEAIAMRLSIKDGEFGRVIG